MQVQSPLFPVLLLVFNGTDDLSLVPQLPDKPQAQTGSVQVFIVPTEKTLFVEGFEAHEYEERPPALLRGCLCLRVLKPTKIKLISLLFKGQQRTDWPEGIPPKKTTFVEFNDLISHTWPFYQVGMGAPHNGADLFKELAVENEVSHLSLGDTVQRSVSPSLVGSPTSVGSFFARNLLPGGLIRRTASPSNASQTNGGDFSDISTVISGDSDSKQGQFLPGDYIYNFEHPLPLLMPETCSVTFGSVLYYLEASIIRSGTFKSNLTARLPINVVRTPAENNLEENEPIVISRDWEDQLRYEIVIGGKSTVLDSYLPLAFRFVPLWGKVALHRIRVYLTENLEYYCQNKKVHRLEPPRKYLLLEHKAGKGKSLLGNADIAHEDDDDILPRELEFQLYVPKDLQHKNGTQIHPDTSFDTIQAHHWIKICLRISRKDAENPEKRKHYEISIDSPIRVLSQLAARGNTLLPAYDSYDCSQEDVSSPPLSPEVLNIDLTLQPFHHIHTPTNNEDAVERDVDMHLDANLYKPDGTDSGLKSPQAVPHPGTFSPLNSPVQRPIHLLRRPSVNPPPFGADMSPPGLDSAPPPAYDDEMSPLRIDEDREEPIKDTLRKQLGHSSADRSESKERERGRGRNSTESSLTSVPDGLESKDELQQKLRENVSGETDAGHGIETITAPPPVPVIATTAPDHALALPLSSLSSSKSRTSLSLPEEDITDMPGSPLSQRSNSISLGSSDLPLDQTVPLLNLSTSSVNTNNDRNASMGSLFDLGLRRPSHPLPTLTSDLEDYRINGKLLLLRNPRIKKHYQEETYTGPVEPQLSASRRQKSFGVVQTDDAHESEPSSAESDLTIKDKPAAVPGFKVGYVID